MREQGELNRASDDFVVLSLKQIAARGHALQTGESSSEPVFMGLIARASRNRPRSLTAAAVLSVLAIPFPVVGLILMIFAAKVVGRQHLTRSAAAASST
jgi:hypothetical protein